ncbi:transcriptional regulator [Ochrobactrum sp. 695/2009]|uniref:Transcriptional regulator n=1 Tax=Brucella intermedia TaxID=94625 RepID=A0A7V6U1K9_9HYPH|nr:ChrR family anti-sigma-E factor [Brucella intermedia]PJR87619.1 transcriptional regulator [Ochrobactrum sp. 721/2009]PJT13613.1 transcriptional regulator [Ochrobactrum sp. 720/2009]PJT18302.1 transcriptional regulator [Ochrobactrum sp. 715/2009]PJT28509.1 transcriptional regulator [Ochrobactrum sp. 695/2009]PJT33678.1 transcriptional regulator [Ochrobactrum sp. 689/2009]
MDIKHHLSDELLSGYAAGTLAEGWSIAVATHLALCPACRSRLKQFEQIGGQLLDAVEPQKLEVSTWDSFKDRLQKTPQSRESSAPRFEIKQPAVIPEPLRSYVGGDLPELKWKSLGRGAYQVSIETRDSETQVRLLRIPAGKPVPEHGHGGRELTLVLSGSFHDGTGLFARGDIEEADADLVHQPIASSDGDCICLAVTDAPLKFQSWLMRLMQPLIGI